MPLKQGEWGAIAFWESVASKFHDNDFVFYELYNEPHINSEYVFMHGNDDYVGMLDMETAVRKYAPDAVLVIAGGKSYAYDADTLISLDKDLQHQNAMWNFHPYMGPN